MCKVPIFVQWIGLSLLSVLVIEPWLLDGYELQCFPELLPMISDTEFYLNSWIGLGGEISGQTDWYHLNMRSPFVHYCYMLETSTLENNTWRHLKLDITCCKKKGSSSVGLLSRSQWPRGLKRRSSAARLLRLWVQIPPGAWMSVRCECWMLSGRGVCVGLITRPEQSYWLWCVVVSDQETSKTRRLKPATGLWKYNHSGL